LRRLNQEIYIIKKKERIKMENVVSYNSYKLQKGASAPDFLLVMETLFTSSYPNKKGLFRPKYLLMEKHGQILQFGKQ